MGPTVLGSTFPAAYEALFQAGEDRQVLRDQHDAETQRLTETLQVTGVTDPAIHELRQQRQAEWEAQLGAIEALRDRRAAGLIWAVFAAIIVVMVLEALVSPHPDSRGQSEVRPECRRLISTRYALIALAIAIMLARPTLLAHLSMMTTSLIILVALVAGLVPLGPSRERA